MRTDACCLCDSRPPSLAVVEHEAGDREKMASLRMQTNSFVMNVFDFLVGVRGCMA